MNRPSSTPAFIGWDSYGYLYQKSFAALSDAVAFAKRFDSARVFPNGAAYTVEYHTVEEVLS